MIVFRVDGNNKIGLGHIMRCVSLADYAVNDGKEVVFITAEAESKAFIENKGFQALCLYSDYEKMNDELDSLLQILSTLQCDKIIVDSYYVSSEYFEKLSKKFQTLYVDDLMAKAYPVHQILNYNINASEKRYIDLYRNSCVTLPKLFIGLKYVPLRKEFLEKKKKEFPSKVEDVFVSTGGSDPCHMALELAKYIVKENYQKFRFHFAIGQFNEDYNEIDILSKEMDNIYIYHGTPISEVMTKCDIAISAGGSTLYELCYLGLPTISYTVADNQIDAVKEFEKNSLIIGVGDIRSNKRIIDMIIEKAEQLYLDFVLRERMYKTCLNMIPSVSSLPNIFEFDRA